MKISRRDFLKGSAATTAAALLGSTFLGSEAFAEPTAGELNEENSIWDMEEVGEPTETMETQMCIIGGGGTGLAAACQARQLGLDVLLLEKRGATGGSFIGTEGLFAAQSSMQKALGVDFTPSEVIAKVMDFHHWIPDIDMYNAFFNKSASTVDWLIDLGVEFDHVQSLGDSEVCWHVYKGSDHPGIEFMASMLAAAEKLEVPIELKTAVKKILLDDEGKVEGVLAVREDGTVVKVVAPVVLIATGGYSNNIELASYLTGMPEDLFQPCGQFDLTGDGIKMGKSLGAALAHAPGTIAFYGPVPRGSAWTKPLNGLTLQPIVWVNQNGRRFVREDMFLKNFAFAGLACAKQKKIFTLCNQAMLDRLESGEGALTPCGVWLAVGQQLPTVGQEMQDNIDKGTAFVADTIEELAEKMGVDPESLAATWTRYNELCKEGKDADLQKPDEYMISMEEGPFYAVDCQNGYFCSVGGLAVTDKTEVKKEDDTIIPGLYAGGCDTGGFYGDSYDVGIAGGSCAGWAMNSGRIAAEQAKEYLEKI